MRYIAQFIEGTPYGRFKSRGNLDAPEEWKNAIVEQTGNLPKVSNACILRVTFLLPADRFPLDYPYGPDLDNLLKLFLDALGKTVFSSSKGGDSCVISVQATKAKVDEGSKPGAALEIVPVTV